MSLLKGSLYYTERRQLTCRGLPPTGRAVFVFQDGFGYSKVDVPQSKDERRKTFHLKKAKPEPLHLVTGAATCHLVSFSAPKQGVTVLAQLDQSIDSITAVYRMMAYLVKQGLINHPHDFTEVSILKSIISAPVTRTYLTLQLLGYNPQVFRSVPLFEFVGHIDDGTLAHFDNPSLSARPALVADVKRNSVVMKEAAARRALFCSNDSRFHDDVHPFEVLPGVPAFAFRFDAATSANSHAIYAVNVPLNFKFFQAKLPKVPGVRVDVVTSTTSGRDYLRVHGEESTELLVPLLIRRVQSVLFAIAEQIARSSR